VLLDVPGILAFLSWQVPLEGAVPNRANATRLNAAAWRHSRHAEPSCSRKWPSRAAERTSWAPLRRAFSC